MNGIKTLRAVAVVAVAAATSLFVAAPAVANYYVNTDRVVSSSPCADRDFSRIFSDFNDRALYTLAPGGDFEAGGAGWTLGRGAYVAGGSSSVPLGSTQGTKSLSLARGASATTPAFCVEQGFPSFRFVSSGADVGVEVLYAWGRSTYVGQVDGGAGWDVTHKVSLAQGLFGTGSGGSAQIRLRFTALRGAARVDDVYVDPRLRR